MVFIWYTDDVTIFISVGSQVIYLLNKLSDEALKSQKFSWKRPEYVEEEDKEDNVIEDDSELTMDKLNDELAEEVPMFYVKIFPHLICFLCSGR